jgi:hypothetical protein
MTAVWALVGVMAAGLVVLVYFQIAKRRFDRRR